MLIFQGQQGPFLFDGPNIIKSRQTIHFMTCVPTSPRVRNNSCESQGKNVDLITKEF